MGRRRSDAVGQGGGLLFDRPPDGASRDNPEGQPAQHDVELLHAAHGHADFGSLRRRTELQPDNPHPPRLGKTDPRFTDGETPIDNWTTAQKNLGFTSTTIEGEEVAHCYGKNGYLKLGDDKGHGADLISPYTNTLRSDSLLMVSFRAVAFTDYMTGARDDNKITVEVLGGGVIRDFAQSEKTTIDLEAGYYDISSEEFPEDMWEGHDFLVFVAGTKANPITANTRVRIICGSLTQNSAVNNRIYLDNFYIRRLQKVEEDYFAENNGSGKDIILGAPFDEEEQE